MLNILNIYSFACTIFLNLGKQIIFNKLLNILLYVYIPDFLNLSVKKFNKLIAVENGVLEGNKGVQNKSHEVFIK